MQVRMVHEFRESPTLVARQQAELAKPLAEIAAHLRQRPPQVVVTCARGSSAHAASFGKHLIERFAAIPVAAAAPNIASVYGQRLNLRGQLFLAISQSGRSDDLVEATKTAKASGALTVAIVNAADSPLAAECDVILPIGAGPEMSVAASKSFVATLTALTRLAAAWMRNNDLETGLARLPDRLAAASELDWTAALAGLSSATSLVTIGRGPTLAIAREASLKLKEICELHAEAFSGAEFRHGPIALVYPSYPVLLFMPTDIACKSMRQLAEDLRCMGTALFVTEGEVAADGQLPVLPADVAETDAICLIQSFYAMAVQLADRRGTEVDRPRHLQKVTRTV